MSNWLLRGLVFAAGMVLVRLVQGALINTWETKALLISVVLLAIFLFGTYVWGFFDGKADAEAQLDPDRRDDLAMTWLLAGLVAGVVSGAATWCISLVYQALYTQGLLNEISTLAAFTAIVVFLPAIVGVATGRYVADRKSAKAGVGPRSDDDSPDTDVFAAVRDDSAPGPVATEQRTSSVATEEREADTVIVDDKTEEISLHKPRGDKD
ncbi:MAG: B-4DMT family transporter [Mycobacterium sp.]